MMSKLEFKKEQKNLFQKAALRLTSPEHQFICIYKLHSRKKNLNLANFFLFLFFVSLCKVFLKKES